MSLKRPQQATLEYLLMILFLFSIPYGINVSNWIIGFWVLITLFSFKYNTSYYSFKKSRMIPFVIFSAYFTWKIIALLYSSSVDEGLKDIEKSLSLLIFPLIFFFRSQENKLDAEKLLKIHIASCVAFFVAAESYIVYNILLNKQSFKLLLSYKYGYNELAGVFHNTPNYLSFFITIGALFCLYLFSNSTNKITWAILFLCLLIIIVQLQTKAHIIFLVLSTPFFIYKMSGKIEYSVVVITVIAVVAICGILLFNNVSGSQQRHLQKRFLRSFSFDDQRNNEDRLQRWLVSIELIKENPLLGTGTGEDDIRRREKFAEKNFTRSLEKDYNDHNQYLETLVTTGVLGFLFFLAPIFLHLKGAISVSFWPSILFLSLFIFFCLTESVLERNKGVIIFSFYHALFFSTLLIDQGSKSNSQTN